MAVGGAAQLVAMGRDKVYDHIHGFNYNFMTYEIYVVFGDQTANMYSKWCVALFGFRPAYSAGLAPQAGSAQGQ